MSHCWERIPASSLRLPAGILSINLCKITLNSYKMLSKQPEPPLAKLKDSTDLAYSFIEFGRKILSEHKELFGIIPTWWEYEMSFAENEYRKRFSTRSQ